MSTTAYSPPRPKVIYPETDGQPMAGNTVQFQWIVTIQGGIDGVFEDDPNVFVAGDLFWYPVEGNPDIRTAPGILVAFGRPKGRRGSYKQWEEGSVAPQVLFEILSPSNRTDEMLLKFQFYERYGVEEYYVYDPDRGDLNGWVRRDGRLQQIPSMQGWISPRLKVRFELVNGELVLYGPDGRQFATFLEVRALRNRAEQARREAAEQAERAERLAAQLRALGIEPNP